MDELKPCPWCKNQAIIRDFGNFMVVECRRCNAAGPSLDTQKSAIVAWNALPRAMQWTEYDGTESTLPPKDVTVLLCEFKRTGSLFCEAAKPCWFVHGSNDRFADGLSRGFNALKIGDRWMAWPGEK